MTPRIDMAHVDRLTLAAIRAEAVRDPKGRLAAYVISITNDLDLPDRRND